MILLLLGVAAGCSPGQGHSDSTLATIAEDRTTTVTTATTPVPTTSTIVTGDLTDPEIRTVTVDGKELLVAWADTPETRSRGLMEVDDLGDLDGMLFDLGSERVPAFTMRNTLIPLDIAFFGSDGQGRGFLEMVPCQSEPCPTYRIDRPARYALEVPAGSFEMGPDPLLEIGPPTQGSG